MLILSRFVGQTIVIGENTSVTVLGVTGDLVRIGVAAPREIPVDREEIFLRKQREHYESQINTGRINWPN